MIIECGIILLHSCKDSLSSIDVNLIYDDGNQGLLLGARLFQDPGHGERQLRECYKPQSSPDRNLPI